MNTDVSDVQLQNALLPISVTSGRYTSVNDEHPRKTELFRIDSEGNDTERKDRQLSKAALPMKYTLDQENVAKFLQSASA